VVFFDAAVDREAGRVRGPFRCPECGAAIRKREAERAVVDRHDPLLGREVRQAKTVPVLVRYRYGGKCHEKRPDPFDLALILETERMPPQDFVPTAPLPPGMKTPEPIALGITHVHHFYTARNLRTLAAWFAGARETGGAIGRRLLMAFTGVAQGASHLNRHVPRPTSFPFYLLAGTLYVGSLRQENCPLRDLTSKALLRLTKLRTGNAEGSPQCMISTQSATDLRQVPDASIDYVFVDPPFGGNLQYSELNYLWEAWLGAFTETGPEAVESSAQGKSKAAYGELMARCFAEFRRVLRPGRWMTVEFHNSSRRTWDQLHGAIRAAGFVIADVRTLDKREGTFNQIAGGASVKQDLVISAYRSAEAPDAPGPLIAGTEESAWDFVARRLAGLPSIEASSPEQASERSAHLLFDRMVAHHLCGGMQVPLSAAEFYAGLAERFPATDGLHALPPLPAGTGLLKGPAAMASRRGRAR
jgi:hypothetical protein